MCVYANSWIAYITYDHVVVSLGLLEIANTFSIFFKSNDTKFNTIFFLLLVFIVFGCVFVNRVNTFCLNFYFSFRFFFFFIIFIMQSEVTTQVLDTTTTKPNMIITTILTEKYAVYEYRHQPNVIFLQFEWNSYSFLFFFSAKGTAMIAIN